MPEPRTEGVIRTLVVDDDYRVAGIHAAFVDRVPGFRTVGSAHTAREAVERAVELRPDLVLLDLYLPDGHGLDLVSTIRAATEHTPDFLVITGDRDVSTVRAAISLGAVHYLLKPFGFDQFQEKLTAYRVLWQRSNAVDVADQDTVDDLYAVLHPATPTVRELPKRFSAPTMEKVWDTVRAAADGVSAAEAASAIGISRPTAQRYLSYLAQRGVVELRLRYGAPGRPEQSYRAHGH